MMPAVGWQTLALNGLLRSELLLLNFLESKFLKCMKMMPAVGWQTLALNGLLRSELLLPNFLENKFLKCIVKAKRGCTLVSGMWAVR